MHDRSYHWQDHVPPTVGWRADLLIAIAVLAGLAMISVERMHSASAQHLEIVRSIESASPTGVAHGPQGAIEPMFTQAGPPAHLLHLCALPQTKI